MGAAMRVEKRCAAYMLHDVLPLDEAMGMRKEFRRADFERKTQHRAYTEGFANGDLAGPPENYASSFGRSSDLENDIRVHGTARRYLMNAAGGGRDLQLRAYRLGAGDYFRTHTDETMGEVAFVYYMSQGWKWDWGGLLMVEDGGVVTPFLPRFNSMVVMDAGAKVPHFVTEVSKHAQEHRFMLAGFFNRA